MAWLFFSGIGSNKEDFDAIIKEFAEAKVCRQKMV